MACRSKTKTSKRKKKNGIDQDIVFAFMLEDAKQRCDVFFILQKSFKQALSSKRMGREGSGRGISRSRRSKQWTKQGGRVRITSRRKNPKYLAVILSVLLFEDITLRLAFVFRKRVYSTSCFCFVLLYETYMSCTSKSEVSGTTAIKSAGKSD
jgi:hypothetical protein